MHEISVLEAAAELADRTAAEAGVAQVAYLTLEVGELSGYLPIFFEKYWPVVVEARPRLAQAELRMEMARGEGLCLDCHALYNVMEHEGRCPACGSRRKEVLGGQDLVLKEIGYVEE